MNNELVSGGGTGGSSSGSDFDDAMDDVDRVDDASDGSGGDTGSTGSEDTVTAEPGRTGGSAGGSSGGSSGGGSDFDDALDDVDRVDDAGGSSDGGGGTAGGGRGPRFDDDPTNTGSAPDPEPEPEPVRETTSVNLSDGLDRAVDVGTGGPTTGTIPSAIGDAGDAVFGVDSPDGGAAGEVRDRLNVGAERIDGAIVDPIRNSDSGTATSPAPGVGGVGTAADSSFARDVTAETAERLNPARIASDTIGVASAGANFGDFLVDEDGSLGQTADVATTAAGAAPDVARASVESVRENPRDAAVSVTSGAAALATGAGAGRLISRGARGASQAVRSGDGFDVDGLIADNRAQTGGGRRTSTDTMEQETITVEQMADDDVIGRAAEQDLEDIPGVSVTNRGADTRAQTGAGTRSADELEADIRDSLDEDLVGGVDDAVATTDTTATAVGAAGVGATIGTADTVEPTAGSDTSAVAMSDDAVELEQFGDQRIGGGTLSADATAGGDTTTADDTTTTDDTTTNTTTTTETVTEATTVAETVTAADTIAETTTTADLSADIATVEETPGMTTDVSAVGAGRPQPSRPRTPDLELDEPESEESLDPLGAVGADFENPALGVDAASDDIVDSLDELEDLNGP